MTTLTELGELATLARFLPHLSQPSGVLVGPGDDAAVLAAGGDVVITVDTMFEGTDFRLDWSSFHDLGVKAVTTNLTDVAAMGAAPTGLVIALGVAGDTDVADLEAFAKAADATLREYAPDAGVVGGDLSVARQAVISVTAFGDMQGRKPVLRSGARAGDLIVVAGELGLAGTALTLLAAGERSVDDLWREHPRPMQAHLAPTAPVHLGPVLADAGATSMLDVSDGLALDAGRVARASGVVMRFDRHALMRFDAELEYVLHGGEDHALLATLPEAALTDDLLAAGVRVIGRVAAGDAAVLLDDELVSERGWDPFRR